LLALNWEEIREWIKFLVIIVGAFIAMRSYIIGQKQRKLENSFRLLDLFNKNIQEKDIEEWTNVFIMSSESSGAEFGFFYSKDGQLTPFTSLFSEGPEDQGAVSRIVEQIDLIAYESNKGTIDLRVIYSNIGQLIETTYEWFGNDAKHVIKTYYPNFEKMMKKNKGNFEKWPRKTISYSE